MGYTTNFTGKFNINPPLSAEDNEFLTNFSYSRRVARKVDSKYGVEGEWYVGKDHIFNQEQNVIDYNRPPSTQPGLWCQWIPDEDGASLAWDGGEKFYNYIQWLEYLIEKYFKPRNYILNGEVYWNGEDTDDRGVIKVINNQIKIGVAKTTYNFD
jgi:hypothetical protein